VDFDKSSGASRRENAKSRLFFIERSAAPETPDRHLRRALVLWRQHRL
jgi:hypothetical protein